MAPRAMSPLEDEGFCEPRFLKQEFQDEADPEVLLDDRWPDPESGRRLGEDVTPVFRPQPTVFIHLRLLFLRFPEWLHIPIRSPSWYRGVSAAGGPQPSGGGTQQCSSGSPTAWRV